MTLPSGHVSFTSLSRALRKCSNTGLRAKNGMGSKQPYRSGSKLTFPFGTSSPIAFCEDFKEKAQVMGIEMWLLAQTFKFLLPLKDTRDSLLSRCDP